MNQSEFAEALSSIPAGSDAFAFEKVRAPKTRRPSRVLPSLPFPSS